jgi:hypothetical protein
MRWVRNLQGLNVEDPQYGLTLTTFADYFVIDVGIANVGAIVDRSAPIPAIALCRIFAPR